MNGAIPPKLPDVILDRMLALSDVDNGTTWAIGDLAMEVVDEFGARLGKSEVRRQLANRTRYQPSGIRAREAVSRFWDQATREEYDVLDWSHFRLAQRQPDPLGDLTLCVSEEQLAKYGRPMPYNAYAEMVRERKQTRPTAFRECMARALPWVTRGLDAAGHNAEQATAAAHIVKLLERLV